MQVLLSNIRYKTLLISPFGRINLIQSITSIHFEKDMEITIGDVSVLRTSSLALSLTQINGSMISKIQYIPLSFTLFSTILAAH